MKSFNLAASAIAIVADPELAKTQEAVANEVTMGSGS